MRSLLYAFLLGLTIPLWTIAQTPTPLWSRGYSVIPAPQEVQLLDGDIVLDGTWSIEAGRLPANHISVRTLAEGLAMNQASGATKLIHLVVEPHSVITGGDSTIDEQAYRLHVEEGRINITGNGQSGLFYGVQTLLQLAKRDASGRMVVPRVEIEDWPKLQLRFLHWDTKHHQDRIETLKRYLDEAARYKVNMIGFELEDKFAYPSHPSIGAPGAFTTSQLQEIVDYGLERYIQVVPIIQAPAHMAYVLKHPEFADLRSDGCNYMSCTCDPRLYDLLFSMFDDVINATKGVDYVFASTDEVYFAGNCPKCPRPYNAENRSLAWVDYVRKVHDHLSKRGRRMLVWAEFPLLAEHIKLLPPDIIDGVIGEADYIGPENERGIRQLTYNSMQGAEFLFPNHFAMEGGRRAHIEAAFENILHGRHWQGKPIGAFGAAWDDSGLHNETFWLGWTAVAAWAWHPGQPSVEQYSAEFMQSFYGPRVHGMLEVYRLMQSQARAWERTWDYIPSRTVPPSWGSYFGKGIGTHRSDMTLAAPLVNDLPDWFPDPAWTVRYKHFIDEAKLRKAENKRLIEALQTSFGQADRNRYNLEVFLALARFMGHHWDLILDLAKAEDLIRQGQAITMNSKTDDQEKYLSILREASRTVENTHQQGLSIFADLKAVYEKSRYPKGQSVDGRTFLHVQDDIKDHWADRRADLSFMMAPEESIHLEAWANELRSVIRLFEEQNDLPAKP